MSTQKNDAAYVAAFIFFILALVINQQAGGKEPLSAERYLEQRYCWAEGGAFPFEFQCSLRLALLLLRLCSLLLVAAHFFVAALSSIGPLGATRKRRAKPHCTKLHIATPAIVVAGIAGAAVVENQKLAVSVAAWRVYIWRRFDAWPYDGYTLNDFKKIIKRLMTLGSKTPKHPKSLRWLWASVSPYLNSTKP